MDPILSPAADNTTEELSDEELKRLWKELEALDILFPPPSQPVPVARNLMKGRTFRGLPTLLHWRNGWMRWEEAHWIEIEERTVRSECYQRLENAVYMTPYAHDQPSALPTVCNS